MDESPSEKNHKKDNESKLNNETNQQVRKNRKQTMKLH